MDTGPKAANTAMMRCMETTTTTRGKYNGYTPGQCTQIGKYVAGNGLTRAVKAFSQLLGDHIKIYSTTAVVQP